MTRVRADGYVGVGRHDFSALVETRNGFAARAKITRATKPSSVSRRVDEVAAVQDRYRSPPPSLRSAAARTARSGTRRAPGRWRGLTTHGRTGQQWLLAPTLSWPWRIEMLTTGHQNIPESALPEISREVEGPLAKRRPCIEDRGRRGDRERRDARRDRSGRRALERFSGLLG